MIFSAKVQLSFYEPLSESSEQLLAIAWWQANGIGVFLRGVSFHNADVWHSFYEPFR